MVAASFDPFSVSLGPPAFFDTRAFGASRHEAETLLRIGPFSGKSTLPRTLMTLDRPDAGRVEIGGDSLYPEERNGTEVPASEAHIRRVRGRVGMVFQHFNLFPHLTALDNVIEAPVHVLGLSREDAVRQGTEYLRRVGLSDKADALPHELSGGQKQRVAIARALAMHPPVMLFDEITSALDPELVGGALELLADLSRSREMTMLIVTHEVRFARESSDRILFLDRGLVLEDDEPGVIFTAPRHKRTRVFLQSILKG